MRYVTLKPPRIPPPARTARTRRRAPAKPPAASAALRQLIVLELTAEQRSAVEAPYRPSASQSWELAGTGKSTALAERIARLPNDHPAAEPLLFRSDRAIAEYAVALLRSHEQEVTLVDDVDAELAFAQTCSPLFELQWEEFARDQLDPEVPGLRSPERFLQSAFRLIRRLRDADIEPASFSRAR